jgi:SAM-dependent methyltransferase
MTDDSLQSARPLDAGRDELMARLRALDEAVTEATLAARDALGRVADLEEELHGVRELLGESGSAARLPSLGRTGIRGHDLQASGPGGRFATLYPAFQDRFRGSEEEITRRLQVYLPDVHRLVGSGGVVDVGPGRGEWLALLRERGVPAYGVESNQRFVDSCRARGLEVIPGDGAEHLHALTPGSVDVVTAFHVIEHLDIEELLALIDGARQALRPGGCLLVETPNPTNLVMGACDFYCDPTHRSPLPPALTEYLMAAHGFGDIEVRPLHPKQHPQGPTARLGAMRAAIPTVLIDALEQSLFGPQDYAVLGYRLP